MAFKKWEGENNDSVNKKVGQLKKLFFLFFRGIEQTCAQQKIS